jgi:hypothetical protein
MKLEKRGVVLKQLGEGCLRPTGKQTFGAARPPSIGIIIIRLFHAREFFLQSGGGHRRRYVEVMSRMPVPISYGANYSRIETIRRQGCGG